MGLKLIKLFTTWATVEQLTIKLLKSSFFFLVGLRTKIGLKSNKKWNIYYTVLFVFELRPPLRTEITRDLKFDSILNIRHQLSLMKPRT